MSKIRRDFWQLSTLIANISGMHEHFEYLNSNRSTTFFHSLLGVKNLVNFGPLTKSYRHSCWPTQVYFFRETTFQPLGGAGPLNFFTRTGDWPRYASRPMHAKRGSSKNFKNVHLKFGLKLSIWVPITFGLVGVTSRNFSMWPAGQQAW